MAWDEHVNFSKDTLDEVSDRCYLFQENVGTLGVTYNFPPTFITWGGDIYTRWTAARVKAESERGEKDVMYEHYQYKFDETRELGVNIKLALIGIIGDADDKDELIDQYGLLGETPRTRSGLKQFCDQIKDTDTRLRAAGDERILALETIDKLAASGTQMMSLWHDAQQERQESSEAYDELHDLKNEIAKKLRASYGLAVVAVGKYSPDLLLLGFAPATPPPGHGQPEEPEELDGEYQDPNYIITWNPCENTTSYQLKYSLDNDEWVELYSGEDNSYTYDPPAGLRYYKVRARNVHGFSGWSNTIEFDVPEVPE